MFKIIKTSTYKQLLQDLQNYKDIAIKQDTKIVDFTTTMIDALNRITELETMLNHHQTAKKLPIKKSKDK